MTFSALDSALLGPLFATEAMREVFTDRARLAAMLEVEAALAEGLEAGRLAPPGLAKAVRAVVPEELDLGALGVETAVAGVPVIPFVKAVQRRLPPEFERAFHHGATTQDIADTGLVLQLREAMLAILPELVAILESLSQLAERHARTACAGRTYGQHAAPVTFGYKVTVWLKGIAEVAGAWQGKFDRISHLSLGGPVGTAAAFGEELDDVVDAMCARLRLSGGGPTWHTRRARMAELGFWLAALLGALGKMAGDVAHLSSTEVGEVAEPHMPGRGGSSSMPHKRNPVGATVILAAASASKGHVGTLLDAMIAAHERPAGAWHAEWHALPQLFGLVSGALREARGIAEGLEVDARRMRANLELTRGLVLADTAAALLAPSLGRAEAHARVEEAARRVREGAASLEAALLADPAVTASVSAADLTAAFDPAPAVEAAAKAAERALDDVWATIEFLRDCPT